MDDVIIFARDESGEYIQVLKVVLYLLRATGLKSSPAKFWVGCRATKYLRYTLGNGSIKSLIDKVRELVESPVFTTN